MRYSKVIILAIYALSTIDAREAKGRIRRLPSAINEPLDVSTLSYPLVGTAVVIVKDDGSPATNAVHELDLIPSPKTNLFNNKANSITFLVHNAQEAEYILGLDGLRSIKYDDEVLNQKFFEDNNKLSKEDETTASNYDYSTVPGFPCYRDLAGSYAWLDDINAAAIAGDYEGLDVSVTDIGDSYLKTINEGGYDIRVLKITSTHTDTSKAPFVSIFGLHAREMAPPELGMRFADMLLAGYGTDAEITAVLDQTDVHLVIQANPDGRYVAEINQDWYQRKNMHDEGGECEDGLTGVDLNRNFPFKWGPSPGSSGNKCSSTYRGSAKQSEPETEAIVTYIDGIFPPSQRKEDPEGEDLDDSFPSNSTGVFFDIHSYGDLIIWPWAYQERLTANDVELQTLARKFKYYNDYALAGPEWPDFLYVANGVTDDHVYGELGVPAYTLELGSAFYQDCSEFEDSIVEKNLPVLFYGAKVAGAPYMTPCGPDIIDVGSPFTSDPSIAPSIPQNVNLFFIVEASDNAMSDLVPESGRERDVDTISTGDQNIAEVNVYLDVHPYDTDPPTPILMSGATTSTTALHYVDIDVTGLTLGDHILHIVATDSDGFSGPVTSRFFSVCDPDDPACTDDSGGGSGDCVAPGDIPEDALFCTDRNKSQCCTNTCKGGTKYQIRRTCA